MLFTLADGINDVSSAIGDDPSRRNSWILLVSLLNMIRINALNQSSPPYSRLTKRL